MSIYPNCFGFSFHFSSPSNLKICHILRKSMPSNKMEVRFGLHISKYIELRSFYHLKSFIFVNPPAIFKSANLYALWVHIPLALLFYLDVGRSTNLEVDVFIPTGVPITWNGHNPSREGLLIPGSENLWLFQDGSICLMPTMRWCGSKKEVPSSRPTSLWISRQGKLSRRYTVYTIYILLYCVYSQSSGWTLKF